MGYTTDFDGQFDLDEPLTDAQVQYLTRFAETRRMRRKADRAAGLPDPLREAVGLPIGPEAAYFVGGRGFAGQTEDGSVADHNEPPSGQPGLWCHWVPSVDGRHIEWDGGEKFYDYGPWLEYVVTHFLKPWGRVLNGTVRWSGEDSGDLGSLIVTNNGVVVKPATIHY